jgi:hypothetical protein
MASKETQRKLLLTVAFAGAVTAWIALRISKDDDKRTDASVAIDAALGSAGDAMTSTGDAAAVSDAFLSTAEALSDATTASETGSLSDAASLADVGTSSDAAVAAEAGALSDAAMTVRPEPTGDALLLQLELTAEARKPLLSLLAAVDAGGANQKQLGKLTVPGGRLGLYGCVVHAYSEDREVLVPAGVYPLMHVTSSFGEALVLKVLDTQWAALKQVATLDIGGERLCLMPKEAATELEAKGSLEGLLDLLRADGGSGPKVVQVPKTKLSFAALDVARDKGPVYLAYDNKGRTAAVLIGAQSK